MTLTGVDVYRSGARDRDMIRERYLGPSFRGLIEKRNTSLRAKSAAKLADELEQRIVDDRQGDLEAPVGEDGLDRGQPLDARMVFITIDMVRTFRREDPHAFRPAPSRC